MTASSRRLHSSLDRPDDPAWHTRRLYSPDLAGALTQAYRNIRRAQTHPEGYFEAFRALVTFRDQPLCAEQRLNLEYALALAYAGEGAAAYALDCLARAWELAERLSDRAAQVEIGYLAGGIWHWETCHSEAYAVYQDAFDALRSLGRGDDEPADPVFALDLTLRMAWRAWELGWFPVCLRHLDEAYALRARWAPAAAKEAVSLAWLDAQLSRIRGRPDRARDLAAAAAELALTHEGPLNAGRAHTILAESTLDVVPLLSTPGASSVEDARQSDNWHSDLRRSLRVAETPTQLLGRARQAAYQGLTLAREADDQIGAAMAQLALRRVSLSRRVMDQREAEGESGIRAAARLLRTARRLGDVSLQGRAQTALADELAAAGRLEAARATYHRAALSLEEHELGGLAVWPRRALQSLADMV